MTDYREKDCPDLCYRVEVRGEWAGAADDGRWRPLCSGTLNQTGKSDEEASTFDTREEADSFVFQAIQGATESPIEARVVVVRRPDHD